MTDGVCSRRCIALPDKLQGKYPSETLKKRKSKTLGDVANVTSRWGGTTSGMMRGRTNLLRNRKKGGAIAFNWQKQMSA